MSGHLLPLLLVIALILLGMAIATAIILAYKYVSIRGQISELTGQIYERAHQMFEEWQKSELDTVRRQERDIAQRQAQVELQEWKKQEEQRLRQDAIQKSQAVTIGKVTEHFIPYLPEFPYNPKDARFIGSPIDFVVFDGLDEGLVRKVVFVEVKTGNSKLNQNERQIRDAVNARRVEWKEIRAAFKVSDCTEPSAKNI